MTDKNIETKIDILRGTNKESNGEESVVTKPKEESIKNPSETEIKNANAAGDGSYGRDNDTIYDDLPEKGNDDLEGASY